MYKAIILDLDGTLLTSKKDISDYTINVIKKIKKTTKFILASARGFSSIKPYIEKLDLLNKDNYTIAFNGSLIVNNLEDLVVDESIDKNKIHVFQEYINNNSFLEWHYYTYDKNIIINDISNIEDFINNNKIYKVVCISDENEILRMRNNMPQNIFDSFQITSSELTRIEFVKKGMKKIDAIKLLLDKLNIDSSEVIAIGDGENDIDMISYAGIGVAMGNATDEVKSVANMVTDTNDRDGVGKILNKLMKESE